MAVWTLETPRVFAPLLDQDARYLGAHGGRGSGKSHFFAELGLEDCLATKGTRMVCIREVQKSLKESSKRLIEDKIEHYNLARSGFKVFKEVIETPGDGIITFAGMQDHTAESIKSLEGFRRAWCEESQTLSARSLSLLRPTIRADGSQIWFSWNPRRRTDAVDVMLRGALLPTGSKVVQANWQHNPKFPAVLEQERLDCLRDQPEQYPHIWDGEYATVLEGAYFAKSIADAKAQGRIGRQPYDPLITFRAFVDIGGTGARADSFVIWVAQFIGREMRVMNYYEVQGQPIGAHIEWLRKHGYTKDNTTIWLPHDGDTQDKVIDVSYASAFRSVGYSVQVVPNQGKGAASIRIEAARRAFPACYFHAPEGAKDGDPTTEAGLAALGWYHEKKDEARNMGMGPEHDWSSHGSDAFGLMCVIYETERRAQSDRAPQRSAGNSSAPTSAGY